MTGRGVEHRFCPTCVLVLLEVMKCPTVGYDLAWRGASFCRGRVKSVHHSFCSRRLFGRSGVRQDAGDPVRKVAGATVRALCRRGCSCTSVSLDDEGGDMHGATTQANVADWEDRCVAVFEGTHDFTSLITDLDF